MDQNAEYLAVKECVDHNRSKCRIAMRFGVTLRTVNRWVAGYKKDGKAYFLHGNTGRSPACRVSDKTRQTIIEKYNSCEYKGCNFAYFTKLLDKYENIHVSEQTVRNILEQAGIYSPKIWHAKRRRIIKEKKLQEEALVKAKAAQEKSEKGEPEQQQTEQQETQPLQSIKVMNDKNRMNPEDSHSTRSRCKYFGELVQMDASSYNWFGDTISHLHVAIDDSTGRVVGAYFDSQETLFGYYQVLKAILLKYGIPVAFLTDRRTVFEYTRTQNPDIEKDTFTQFSYACSMLGIEIKTTSVPETKGRVERLNQTLQGRLPFVFRKEGITDIEAANEYLAEHLDELFNDEFALPIDHTRNVFEHQIGGKAITLDTVNLICSTLCTRSISGQCIRYDKKNWKLVDENGIQQNYSDHTKVTVIKTLDQQLFANVNDHQLLKLEEVPLHAETSRNLDADYEEPKPHKVWIPPMDHPWRYSSFEKHQKSQLHRIELDLQKQDAFLEQLQDDISAGNLIKANKIA